MNGLDTSNINSANIGFDRAMAVGDAVRTDERIAKMKNLALTAGVKGNMNAAKPIDMKQIDEAAHDFEATFISEMLKPMFEGIKTDSMFGGGKGEDTFRGMMVQQYGKLIANAGGIGLADAVKAELVRIQTQANNTANNAGVTNSKIGSGLGG